MMAGDNFQIFYRTEYAVCDHQVSATPLPSQPCDDTVYNQTTHIEVKIVNRAALIKCYVI